jgi:8-oxo-dGTP diphosphatase
MRLVTDSPTPIPPSVPSRFVGADGVVQRVRLGAYAWCENDGCVLLCRISATTPGAGRWTIPGGGLTFGEDPADGLVRELAEETGLRGQIGDLVAVRSAILEPPETKSGHRLQVVGLLYRVTITGGDLRDEPDGSTDTAAWIPFGDLDELPSVPLLRWARTRVGR